MLTRGNSRVSASGIFASVKAGRGCFNETVAVLRRFLDEDRPEGYKLFA
jgi:hypothetical protein